MTHSPSSATIVTPFTYEGEKRLRSKDRVWLVTDVQSYTSAMYGCSTPQRWYRAGALCLDTNHLALVEFTKDDVRAMLKAGLQPAPWAAPRPYGIEVTRIYHGDQEKGRFREMVALIDLDPELKKHGAMLRKRFEREMGIRGNTTPGVWKEAVAWAARANAIERAALSLDGWFAARDVKAIVGDINVSATLLRMVKDGLLIPNGKARRGSKYMRAVPRLVARVDWSG